MVHIASFIKQIQGKDFIAREAVVTHSDPCEMYHASHVSLEVADALLAKEKLHGIHCLRPMWVRKACMQVSPGSCRGAKQGGFEDFSNFRGVCTLKYWSYHKIRLFWEYVVGDIKLEYD